MSDEKEMDIPYYGELKVVSADEVVSVYGQSLLNIVRKLDFGAPIEATDFASSFDDLRGAFSEEQLASGQYK